MTAINDSVVVTVSELVQRWRTTRKSVMAAIREGRLRAFVIGRRTYRVAIAEVERFELAQP